MERELVSLLSELVAIDSVNPSLVQGGAGEAGMARAIAGWAAEQGLDVTVLEATAGRPSVLVRARGNGDGRTLLLCAHTDTVGVAGMQAPHRPRVEGDRVYGRGAYDMKAGLAAALIACREAASRSLRGDVLVACVADEEHASLGVQEALEFVHADAAVVTEPTELEICIAHGGFAWVEVEVTGRAAHGSRPHLGVDAIAKAGPILAALGKLDAALEARRHPLVGRASVHASTIAGGEELSSYPARCVVGIERRTLPGEGKREVEAEVEALLDRCRAADPALEVRRRTLLVREPFAVGEDAEIVRVVREAATATSGSAPPLVGAGYWADAAMIQAAGIPTVMYGPSGEGAHADVEWVSIPDTVSCIRTLITVAERLCA
jgi:acetylornithine deacetylase